MITIAGKSAPLNKATQIANVLNNAINEAARLHRGDPTATTADIEAEMGPSAVAQLKTIAAAQAQTDPAKHATAQTALA